MRQVTKSILLAVALMLTSTPGLAQGQVTPPPGGQRQRLELEQRLQRGFYRQIQTQLQLDQTQVANLQSVTRSFQQERMTLNRAQATLRHNIRTPGLVDMPEEEARALLQEMVTLQEQELDLYRREQAEFLKHVTPVQLIQFYRLREDLGQRVQQLRQGRGQGGGRGGGGGRDVGIVDRSRNPVDRDLR